MRKLLKISMFLISIFILTSSTASMVGAEDAKGTLEVDNRTGKTDAVAQTIKITQDMKGWIATHFDPKVIGEYLSVSELEDQKGRYFLELLSGDGKVLRRIIKSAADVKHILGEINDGRPLINYIDKHRGEINKPRAYNDNRNSNIGTDQKLSKSEGTSKTQRETVANDTAENNKDKTLGKAQTNKPETKIIDTRPKLAKKVEAGNADAKHKQDTRVNSELEAMKRAEQEARVNSEREDSEKAAQETKAKVEQEAKERAEREARVKTEQEDSEKAAQETKAKVEQEAKERAEREARAKAEQEAKERAEREARAKAEQETKERAEQETRAKAEQGIADAQYRLGLMYDDGKGVRKNDKEAVKWYRKAAEQGYASAQYKLGFMYENGRGVHRDDNEAVKWYRKAAEQGHKNTKNMLGLKGHIDRFSSINNQSQNGKFTIIYFTIALATMGGGGVSWYYIRQNRLSERYINYWENAVTHKIPHPFSDVFSKEIDVPEHQEKDDSKVFEMAVLGDLFIESCMSVNALQNYLESYGLTQISDSYDLKSSPPAETITRITNKDEMVLDGFGQPIDADNIPQLVPGSTIDQISSYIQNHPKLFDENNIKSFVGHAGETEVANALKEKGIKAFFADNNQPGFDLHVPNAWLEAKTGIDFSGEVGVLQVKTVNSASSVYRHFSEYLDNGHMVPVLAPDHIVDQLSDHQYRQYLIPFSEVGVNEIPSIISTTSDHIEALATGQYGDVIRHGIEIPELNNVAEELIGSVVKIPLLAVAISSTLSVYRNYKLIQGKKINIVNGVKNTVTDVSSASAKAGVGFAAGSLANIAVNKVAISMGVTGGTGGLAANAYDGIVENLADGISSEDVFNITASVGPAALAIGGILAAGYYARKGFDNIVKSVKGNIYKFKTRKMRKIYDNLVVCLHDLASYFNYLEKKARIQCEINIYGPHYRNIRERYNMANNSYSRYSKEMDRNRKMRLFPPVYYFFIKYAKDELYKSFCILQNNRGEIVDEYESSRHDDLKLGEFLYKYNKAVFYKMEEEYMDIINSAETIVKDFEEERQRLLEKGVID